MTEIENCVVQLCKERKLHGEVCFYNDVADCVNLEFPEADMTSEKARSISRKYRAINSLNENFVPTSISALKDKISSSMTFDDSGNTTSEKAITYYKGEQITPRSLMVKHGFDPDKFELVSAKNSEWQSNDKDSGTASLYSSKITVRPVKDFMWSQSNINEIFKNIKLPRYAEKHTSESSSETGRILFFPISDLHLGLLAEKKVTGNDYNIQIAERLFYYVLNDVVKEVSGKEFDKIMFVIGNDFINSDNITNMTTKGTPQDSCNQWHTIVDKAIELCISGIDILSTIAPVDVIWAVSNHDYHTMYGIMNTLKAYYKDDERITVDNSPMERKYFSYGEVIMGISHDIKPERGLELMSVEAHDMWSSSKSMIWFLGHLHTQMAYSKKGYVEILRLPTVSGWSRWSSQQGYTQTDRRNQAFIIDSKTGIKTTINTVIKL